MYKIQYTFCTKYNVLDLLRTFFASSISIGFLFYSRSAIEIQSRLEETQSDRYVTEEGRLLSFK